MWCISIKCSEKSAPFYSRLFEKFELLSSSWSELKNSWQLSVFFDDKPDISLIKAELITASALFDEEVIKGLELVKVEEKDWLASSLKDFPAFTVGNFYIYGSHINDPMPKNKVALNINASTAFGSGEHETTRGCLLAVEKLVQQYNFGKPLDMGCGSGILAIAIAKLTKGKVYASDVDSEAIAVLNEHAKLNPKVVVQGYVGDGFANCDLTINGPFDLIMANILAKPLCFMASDMFKNCSEAGMIVLSGLLDWQQEEVITAYQNVGFEHLETNTIEGWSTVIMKK